MNNFNDPISDEYCVELLEAQQYDAILREYQGYIKDKVEAYLRGFPYYNQFKDDFFQEVYLHLYSSSLPSPSFLKACKNGVSFRFYLAKSIRNKLNTLLTQERNKREKVVSVNNLYGNDEEEKTERSYNVMPDKSYKHQTDSQDLLGQLKNKFKDFLTTFLATFPKVGYKLILLLKLQARAAITEFDLLNCFPGMKTRDMQKLLEALGEDNVYRHKEDRELFDIVHPYFQKYRKEKGSPQAIQRWINQHITGDKYKKGIIDDLEIRDEDQVFRINDKKLFADFLYEYFRTNANAETNKEQATQEQITKVVALKPKLDASAKRQMVAQKLSLALLRASTH